MQAREAFENKDQEARDRKVKEPVERDVGAGLSGARVQGPGPDRSMGLGADGKGSRTLWGEGRWGTPGSLHLVVSPGLDTKWVLGKGEMLNE